MNQETDVKSLTLAIALLLPSIAFAQDAAVPANPAPPSRALKPAPAAARAAKKPIKTAPDVFDITQILGVRQLDPATYEIDARLRDGSEIHLRANAFVMQSLGAQLGTYGR